MSARSSLLIVIAALWAFLARGSGTDCRTFTRVPHTWRGPRVVSVHLKLEGSRAADLRGVPHGEGTRSYVKVWDGLYLQVYSAAHTGVKRGVFGYSFQFSKNQSGKERLLPTNQLGHSVTGNWMAAFHFRNSDNSGPNEVGPKNVNAPGEHRLIAYQDFKAEIRVLELEIINTRVGEIPSFASLSCLVTVSERKKTEKPSVPAKRKAAPS